MKHLKIYLALLCAIVCWQSAMATDVVIDGLNYSLDESAKTAKVIAGNSKYTGNIVIPSSVTYNGDTYNVTSLGYGCFRGCSSLTSITIPESVTSLGHYCFAYCTSLTSITIPESVTSLGDDCFSNCSSLTSITIPKGVTSLGDGGFYGCSSLTSITIPESLTSLGAWCFSGCSSLTGIQVAEGNTVYDSRENCNAVIETATNTMVYGCNSTTIPASVTSLGESCFRDCSSLTSISIPESVTSLGSSCFEGCSSLASISIPESVTSLGESCFRYCSSLASISIPESVTSLGAWCFSGCSSLTSITIPESVTSLGDYCFLDCSSLASISIPESVTSLGALCFWGCSSLTSINIPEGVTSLGEACFSGCSSLTGITIPESVTSLGYECFWGCSSLTSIQVAEGNTVYDSRENCNAVIETATNTMVAGCGSTIIPKSVTSLGNCCFSGCSSLTSITIPESVTSLGIGCFSGCSSLTSITIPESVTSLGAWCFSGCSSLTSITIPESVTSLGDYCFLDCSSLASISIPESVTSLGEWCFRGCRSLTSITIPESVTSLGALCFYDCSSLTHICIPKNVTHLGASCFGGCGKLTAMTFYADSFPSADENYKDIFPSNLAKIYVPDTALTKMSKDYSNMVYWLESWTWPSPKFYSLIEKIGLSSELSVIRGDKKLLVYGVSPDQADIEALAWASDNESVATVDGNGVVTGVGPGTATITATTTDGSNLSASCVITVVNFGSEWTEVTNSNIGSLTGGSVIKIYPYGYGGNEDMALSSSTTGGTYYDYVLTSTELAGQEGGNEWTLVDAGGGTFYLRNGVGLYWAFQRSNAPDYYMSTVSDQSDAVKVSLVWNTTYSGVAFKNAHDGTYLNNLYGWNYKYNWYGGDEPLTYDSNTTYNVYVSSYKATGIDGISADEETDAVYYQLNGVKLAGEPQKEGIYIRVQDGQSHKVVVKRK